MVGKLILAAANIVGESAVWDDLRLQLVWVDIIGRSIHTLEPDTGRHRIWPVADRPTSIGLRADGGAILGTERHICFWDWTGNPVPVVEVEPGQTANRLNEGAVGPDGAFWVGTMLNNINDDDSARAIPAATGRIYRYSQEGLLRVGDDVFGITNTLAFPRGDQLLTADTLTNTVYSYRIGPDRHLHDRKTVFSGFERGLPDGSCLDAVGRLWTTRVAGGACLTCITPDGELQHVVDLPCTWPTSCAFGGENLDRLFVTSARFTMDTAHIAKNPQEGGIFEVDVGVSGRKTYRFSGSPGGMR